MTALVSRFALIGLSHPRESFEGLHQASIAARAERRSRRTERQIRIWQASGEPIVVPKALSA